MDWHNSARTDHEILDDEEHNEDKQITTWYIVPRNAQNFPRGQFHPKILTKKIRGPSQGDTASHDRIIFFVLSHVPH